MATKIGKYSNNEFVDSTLIQPTKHQLGVPYVSVEETLNAIAKANKIRVAITSSLGGILVLLIFGYAMIAGTLGFMSNNAGGLNWVTRPAFSGEAMQGGYINVQNQKVYASLNTPASTDFISQIMTGFFGVPQSFIGKAVLLNESATISISEDGEISYEKDGYEETLNGIYNGNLRGETKQLVDQYILECISGACENGELVIVDRANIYGVV